MDDLCVSLSVGRYVKRVNGMRSMQTSLKLQLEVINLKSEHRTWMILSLSAPPANNNPSDTYRSTYLIYTNAHPKPKRIKIKKI